MLDYKDLDDDQLNLIDRIFDYDESLIYATMGSGKTVCYLTAAQELINNFHINRVLIIAPLKPAQHVWASEASKWHHLRFLHVETAIGTPKVRTQAVNSNSHICVINIENVAWLVDNFDVSSMFDAICIDELSKFGETSNQCVKKLRKHVKKFKHRVGLTGTPVHEGFTKLYSQVLMLDGGKRLGTNKDKMLKKFFYATDYEGYNWALRKDKEKDFLGLLEDLIYSMPDYTHTLPPLDIVDVSIVLHPDVMEQYNKFKRDSVLRFEGAEIVAENQAVLSGKLEQFANGFVYDEDKVPYLVHRSKPLVLSEELKELQEDETPFIIFYQFEADKRAIKAQLEALGITYGTLDSKHAISAFNANGIQALLLHPKSAGHGLNLHLGGCCDIICYNPIWSNDQFKQLVGRLWRRGAKKPVNVTRLVAKDTVDELKVLRVQNKEEYDELFRAHIEKAD